MKIGGEESCQFFLIHTFWLKRGEGYFPSPMVFSRGLSLISTRARSDSVRNVWLLSWCD